MKEREGEIDPSLSSALIAIHHIVRQAFTLFLISCVFLYIFFNMYYFV